MAAQARFGGGVNPLDVVKGTGILLFMAYHFRVVCWAGDPVAEGYGNAAVGLFFLASGLGARRSLDGRAARPGGKAAMAVGFWRDRAVRVFPMFWLALALQWLLYGLRPEPWHWLGLDTRFWFVGYVLQCWLAAPLLRAFAASPGHAARLAPLALFAAANAWGATLPIPQPGSLAGDNLMYRGLYFAHMALFYLGMLAAPAREARRWPSAGGGALAFALLGGTCLGAAWAAVSELFSSWAGPWAPMVRECAFMGVSAALVAAFAASPARGADSSALAFLGRNSLAVYLFEPALYALLIKARLIAPRQWPTLFAYLGALPPFFWACSLAGKVEAWAMGRVFPRR